MLDSLLQEKNLLQICKRVNVQNVGRYYRPGQLVCDRGGGCLFLGGGPALFLVLLELLQEIPAKSPLLYPVLNTCCAPPTCYNPCNYPTITVLPPISSTTVESPPGTPPYSRKAW